MKQTIEIDIPEGYEVVSTDGMSALEKEGSGCYVTIVKCKKKQTKTFDWFVDEYLRDTTGSTVEELRNWINNRDLETARNRLKKGHYNLVAWEIKIGLFKFICEYEGLSDIYYYLHEYNKSRLAGCSVQYDGLRIRKIFPDGFISDLIKTK